MTVRAKFRCTTVEHASDTPTEVKRYVQGAEEPLTYSTWPRTFRFLAEYDPTVPEDQRYAQTTPSGSITIQVDNPAVIFTPGRSYYLDFTPVDDPDRS